MFATRYGHASVVKALINEGNADVKKTNNYGRTALIIATEYHHDEVVQILMKEGQY